VVGATAGAAAGEATVVVGAGGEAVIWAFAYCFPVLLVQLFGACNSGGVPVEAAVKGAKRPCFERY
jgi:hypothetical protein